MRWLVVLILLTLLVTPEVRAQEARQGGLPNILVVVVDDLGWNDVGYHGSEIETPTLDTLAMEGVELDRFYTASICTPTRAGWLTGRYPIRFGMHGTALAPYELRGFPDAEDTVPEMLARAGYTQRGLIGKWHLGHLRDDYHPLNHGFTSFYGSYTGNLDYFTHLKEGELDWHEGFATSFDAGYVTDLIADEAIQFIDDHAAAPFFLYLPFTAPHAPLQAPPECLDRYPTMPDSERKTYAAMVSCFDDQLARILQALEDHNIRDNTLVWFFSDNGAKESEGGDNFPFKGEKGQTFEGSIRVPALVHWPDGGISGGARLDSLLSYLDVFPTLARAVGQTGMPVNPLDGFDVLDLLQGVGTEPDRDFYSFVDKGDREELAVTAGEWKLRWEGEDLLNDPDNATVLKLYSIYEDPRERTDLSGANPTVVADLISRLQAFRVLRPAQHIDLYESPPSGFAPPTNWMMPTDTVATPMLLAPVDGAVVSDPMVTLAWADIPEAGTYEVQIATAPNFETIVASGDAVASPSFTVMLTPEADYYWRVRALHMVGDNYSFWSAVNQFTISSGGNLSPNAAFSYSCTDLACDFTDQSTDPDGTLVGWSWDFGDGTTSAVQNPSHSFAAEGTYTVALTVTDDEGATDTASQSVTVSLGGGGDPIALSVTGLLQSSRWKAELSWSPADGGTVDVYRDGVVVVSTSDDGAYTDRLGEVSGTFTYQVCETDSGDCSNTASLTIENGAVVSSGNGVETAEATSTELGVVELPEVFEVRRAYPNPFSSQVVLPVALPESAQVEMVVYNSLGQQIVVLARGRYEAGVHRMMFDGNALPSGVYLIRAMITTDRGEAPHVFMQRAVLIR